MAPFHVWSWNKWTELFNLDKVKFTTMMDDEAVDINNGESVIRIVTCMIMIRSYVPGFSRRCTSCWCIRNQMADSTGRQWRSPMISGRVIFTFCQISDFSRQFYAFSKFLLIFKWPKSEETLIGYFFQHHPSPCVRQDFFSYKKKRKRKRKKKNWFWARRVSVAIVTNFAKKIIVQFFKKFNKILFFFLDFTFFLSIFTFYPTFKEISKNVMILKIYIDISLCQCISIILIRYRYINTTNRKADNTVRSKSDNHNMATWT